MPLNILLNTQNPLFPKMTAHLVHLRPRSRWRADSPDKQRLQLVPEEGRQFDKLSIKHEARVSRAWTLNKMAASPRLSFKTQKVKPVNQATSPVLFVCLFVFANFGKNCTSQLKF